MVRTLEHERATGHSYGFIGIVENAAITNISIPDSMLASLSG